MAVIGHNHYDRVAKIPRWLDLLIDHDMRRPGYEATFVMDHDWYSRDFLEAGASLVVEYAKRFTQRDVE